MREVKGYKVFNPDWTCRGFQYEVGKTYKHDDDIEICNSGFHFCEELYDCFNYYDFDPANKIAKVIATGKIDRSDDDSKVCTDELTIIRELSWEEVLRLVNTGKGNSGYLNSGDWNSGYGNSGNRNSGNWNSGNSNSGDSNSGNRNSGDANSGDRNSGDWNSGYGNSRNWNSGCGNSGSRNSGDYNSGNWNSGNWNSGNWNSGNWNSGSRNSGDYNSGHHNSGVFNTTEPTILMFDQPTDWTYRDWRSSHACDVMQTLPYCDLEWVYSDNMTPEQKVDNPQHETTGGFLMRSPEPVLQKWWDELSETDRAAVKSLPNFDAGKFRQITGVDVDYAQNLW